MAISTMFTDSKVGNQVGGLLMVVPILIFIQISALDNAPPLIYLFSFLPVVPTCSILVQLSQDYSIGFVIFKLADINKAVMFTILVIDLVLWLFIYIYLDSVMPNAYGIQKHPCFCFKKHKKEAYKPLSQDD